MSYHDDVLTLGKVIRQRDEARAQRDELMRMLEARDRNEQAMAELQELWPRWRQLIDGFTQDPDWNNEWDAETRQSMIDWGLRHLPSTGASR